MKSKPAVPAVLSSGQHFLTTIEVGAALGCTRHEVRRLEERGILVPRRRDRGCRKFAASDVLRVFYGRQQFNDDSATLFERRVLELLDAGKADVEIVRELNGVPLALVERVRASKEGRPSQSMQVAPAAPAAAQAPQRPALVKAASTFLDAGERRLEKQREQRMKELRKRRAAS
jgi:DNA-binding transcriptional MerR regulator